MELNTSHLNNINIFNTSSKVVSDNQKVTNIANIASNEKSDLSTIDKLTNTSFLNNISSNINKIAQYQKVESSISNQLEITTKIVEIINFANQSQIKKLDDKQPQIKNLIDNYNTISKNTEGSDLEGIFFDGVLGSKPLSPQEILDAVKQQNKILNQLQSNIQDEKQLLIQDTKNAIQNQKTETKVEFKSIDFGKESIQFDASSLNRFEGEIVTSQANGFPFHSEKLLA